MLAKALADGRMRHPQRFGAAAAEENMP